LALHQAVGFTRVSGLRLRPPASMRASPSDIQMVLQQVVHIAVYSIAQTPIGFDLIFREISKITQLNT